MLRLLLVPLLLLAVLPASSASAQSVCPKQLVVDGFLLERVKVQHEEKLPPLGDERSAAVPTCDEGDPSDETTATTFRDLPPETAAMVEDDLYIAAGSVVALADHPLHDAVFGSGAEPAYRRDECRPEPDPVTGAIEEEGALTLHQDLGTVRIVIDARTRIGGGLPASQPLLKGQEVSVATSRCGPRQVADEITFVGAAAAPRKWVPEPTSGDSSTPWIVAVLAGALVVGGAVLLRRRRTAPAA